MAEEVRLPERVINPSDIKIYHMTDKGQEAFRKGIPFLEMIEGRDYNLAFVIDYKQLVRQRVREAAEQPSYLKMFDGHRKPFFTPKRHYNRHYVSSWKKMLPNSVAGFALLLGAVSGTSAQTIDCKMTEENLSYQFFVLHKDGSAYLRRVHNDKSNPLNEKRCIGTYEAEGLEPRVDRSIIHFGKGVYEVQEQGK